VNKRMDGKKVRMSGDIDLCKEATSFGIIKRRFYRAPQIN